MGADQVIDYTTEDFTRNGESYDVLFDAVGKTAFPSCLRSLNHLQAVAAPVLRLRMLLAGMTSNRTFIGGEATPTREDLMTLADLVAASTIRPVIDRSHPLEPIVEAHRMWTRGTNREMSSLLCHSTNISDIMLWGKPNIAGSYVRFLRG